MNIHSSTGFIATYPSAEPAIDAVKALPGWTLLEFGANWCGICQGAQPAIKGAVDAQPGLRHVKVGDGRGQPLGRSFGVKLWPTLVLLRDGVEVARQVRPTERAQISAMLAQTAG